MDNNRWWYITYGNNFIKINNKKINNKKIKDIYK